MSRPDSWIRPRGYVGVKILKASDLSGRRLDKPAPPLLSANKLFKFRFRKNRYTQFLGLVELRTRIRAHHNITSLLAHRTDYLPPMLLHNFPRLFARAIRQSARKHKRLPRQAVALHHALLSRRPHSSLFQFPDQLPVRRFEEKFHNALRHFRPYFRHLSQLFFRGRRKFLQRRKMFRQQLCRALANKNNSQRINQTRQ